MPRRKGGRKKPKKMRTKYIRIKLGEPYQDKEIFVREGDNNNLKKAIRSRNSDRIVKETINVLIGSPDGMHDLAKEIGFAGYIMNNNNKKVLESFRDMISFRIKRLKRTSHKTRKV